MMANFHAILLLSALSHLSLASDHEASSISEQGVFQKVRHRVRDIVMMLQTMQDQVSKDGQDDAELFGKYMFYCRKGRPALEHSIEEAENTDLDELKDNIEEKEHTREKMESDIDEDQAKEADAEKAIKKAKTLREYEKVVFQQESQKLRTDMSTMKKAMSALDEGEELPQSAVAAMKQLSGSGDVKAQDREVLQSYLAKIKEDSLYHGQEIQGILKHMTEVLKKRLTDITDEEKKEREAFADYKDMVQQKAHAIKNDINVKTGEVEELTEAVTSEKDNLEDAARYLMEGPAFLPFIGDSENCTAREDEWAERCQLRTGEMQTIAEAMSMLTDDEMLDEVLQKSLPKPWQEGTHPALLASKQSNQSKDLPHFDLTSLFGKGKNASFTKIASVIDGMVALLGKEKTNISQDKYCGQTQNQTQHNLKKLALSVANLGSVMVRHERNIESLKTDIEEVTAGIKTSDVQIVETAKVRKQAHEENAETLTIDNVTLQLFRNARDRLNSYYSETDQIDDSSQVTLGEIIGQYTKRQVDSAQIISMLETTLADLGSEIARVAVQEKNDQEQWQTIVTEALAKHEKDEKAISQKQQAKAELEAALTIVGQEKRAKMQEVKASTKYLAELQGKFEGFLKPSVCARKMVIAEVLPKTIVLW